MYFSLPDREQVLSNCNYIFGQDVKILTLHLPTGGYRAVILPRSSHDGSFADALLQTAPAESSDEALFLLLRQTERLMGDLWTAKEERLWEELLASEREAMEEMDVRFLVEEMEIRALQDSEEMEMLVGEGCRYYDELDRKAKEEYLAMVEDIVAEERALAEVVEEVEREVEFREARAERLREARAEKLREVLKELGSDRGERERGLKRWEEEEEARVKMGEEVAGGKHWGEGCGRLDACRARKPKYSPILRAHHRVRFADPPEPEEFSADETEEETAEGSDSEYDYLVGADEVAKWPSSENAKARSWTDIHLLHWRRRRI